MGIEWGFLSLTVFLYYSLYYNRVTSPQGTVHILLPVKCSGWWWWRWTMLCCSTTAWMLLLRQTLFLLCKRCYIAAATCGSSFAMFWNKLSKLNSSAKWQQLATVDWELEHRHHLMIQRGFIVHQSTLGSGGRKLGVKMFCYNCRLCI